MILRWKISTRMTSGTVTITDAAMMLPQGISNCELPDGNAIATGTVAVRCWGMVSAKRIRSRRR